MKALLQKERLILERTCTTHAATAVVSYSHASRVRLFPFLEGDDGKPHPVAFAALVGPCPVQRCLSIVIHGLKISACFEQLLHYPDVTTLCSLLYALASGRSSGSQV
jgi:hypothetical protein